VGRALLNQQPVGKVFIQQPTGVVVTSVRLHNPRPICCVWEGMSQGEGVFRMNKNKVPRCGVGTRGNMSRRTSNKEQGVGCWGIWGMKGRAQLNKAKMRFRPNKSNVAGSNVGKVYYVRTVGSQGQGQVKNEPKGAVWGG